LTATARTHLLIKGRVQGIGFRFFAVETARRMGVSGWVRNLANGDVEAEAEGVPQTVAAFIQELKAGHRWARVDSVAETPVAASGKKEPFDIY